jgi:hypothetical protein
MYAEPIFYIFSLGVFILTEITLFFAKDLYWKKRAVKYLILFSKSFLPSETGKRIFDSLFEKTELKMEKIDEKNCKILNISGKFFGMNVKQQKPFDSIKKVYRFFCKYSKYFMKDVCVKSYSENIEIVLMSFIAKKTYVCLDNKECFLFLDNKNILFWLLRLILSIFLIIFFFIPLCLFVTMMKLLLIKPFYFGYGSGYKISLIRAANY